MSNLTKSKIALFCFVLIGCAEPDTGGIPPVLDAIGDIQDAAGQNHALEQATRKAQQHPAESVDVPQTGTYVVEFDTTAGKFSVEVNREWAPIGADRFYKLVKDNFFDGAGFFRVVPGFMVQWGLAADPLRNEKWSVTLLDDPVLKSNTRGYITFAKTQRPNSRSSQVFINFGDNSRLDADGFAPFGKVIEGMEAVDGICSEYGETPDQGMVRMGGKKYLESKFPMLDYITTTTLVKDDLAHDTADEETNETHAEPAEE